MSKPPNLSVGNRDPLSLLLDRLTLGAKVFLRADFCGSWAIDTSGTRQVPFHFVTRGTGWLHQPQGRPVALSAGALVLFPHDGPHVLAASEAPPDPGVINQPPVGLDGPITRLVCGYFSFDRRTAEPLVAGLPGTIVFELGGASPNSEIASLIQLWMAEAESEALGADRAVDDLAGVVFIHILREQVERGTLKGPLGAMSDERLGPVLQAIHVAPGAEHGVDDLARLARMSRSSFAQRFKSGTGMTPGRYVLHWRMHSARQMLESTDQSIAEIADASGYESEVAFRKAFRRYIGAPPGEYRRSLRFTAPT